MTDRFIDVDKSVPLTVCLSLLMGTEIMSPDLTSLVSPSNCDLRPARKACWYVLSTEMGDAIRATVTARAVGITG